MRAPSAFHVIWAIARRELGIAFRRRMVRLLFIFSFAPPIVMAIILVVRVMAKEAVGFDLGWDPIAILLRVQAFPVALIALGLGTPSVARDRSEDVLYLYAVRPVTPWDYTAGKMFAVALPTLLLLLIPSIVIAVLRAGILGEAVTTGDSVLLVLKAAATATVMAVGFAGVSVGPSAATRRGRWALLIAIAFFAMPEPFKFIYGFDGISLGPASATQDLISAMFGDLGAKLGWASAAVLVLYGSMGALLTRTQVQKEMTP